MRESYSSKYTDDICQFSTVNYPCIQSLNNTSPSGQQPPPQHPEERLSHWGLARATSSYFDFSFFPLAAATAASSSSSSSPSVSFLF